MTTRIARRALAVIAPLALAAGFAGQVTAATPTAQMSPATGGQATVFKLKVKASLVRNALQTSEFVLAELQAPAGADDECSSHHTPTYEFVGSKAVFRLDPNDLYSQSWCKGKWTVRVTADDDGDGTSDRQLAKTSFRVR
jgi:hypothetical protein